MSEPLHSIRTVSRRTGLTPHVIRVWERRYGAVQPARTDTNRRQYSDQELARLELLRDLTRGGHSIGEVARLTVDQLRELTSQETKLEGGGPAQQTNSGAALLLTEAVAAVNALNAPALSDVLKRGSVELGTHGLLQRVIAPLAQLIGELWRDGTITAAHEHFASAVIRVFLGHATSSFSGAEGAPGLVVGTPSGQLHELGALLAGATAANLGWRVTYLGASLPAAEIAGAARQNRARAVALSLVYPEDDAKLAGELVRLRELLPPETAILAGGRAQPAYRKTLDQIGARPVNDLAHFGSLLDTLRAPASKPAGQS